MRFVLFLTAVLGVFLAQLTLSEALKCYYCTPANRGCSDYPWDEGKYQDWLKPCTRGQTCLKTIHNDKSVTRTCNNQTMCREDSTSSYYESCFNNVCYEEYCCTGEGCNSAPAVATSVGVLLTASMVLATWVFRK